MQTPPHPLRPTPTPPTSAAPARAGADPVPAATAAARAAAAPDPGAVPTGPMGLAAAVASADPAAGSRATCPAPTTPRSGSPAACPTASSTELTEVIVDREEITVVGRIPVPTLDSGGRGGRRGPHLPVPQSARVSSGMKRPPGRPSSASSKKSRLGRAKCGDTPHPDLHQHLRRP